MYTGNFEKNISMLLKFCANLMSEYGAVVEYWWFKSPQQHLFSSMQPYNIGVKYTYIYGNVYVKIPSHTKLLENSHLTMGMCM